MVNVGFNKATEANIKNTNEFGVSLAAFDQTLLLAYLAAAAEKMSTKFPKNVAFWNLGEASLLPR